MINQIDKKNSTPVIIASVYNPMDQTRTIKEALNILIDSGASHSMAKASLVMKFKNSYLDKANLHIKQLLA